MTEVRLGAGGTVTRLFAPPKPFEKLGTDYDLIMADPPWPTKMRSPKGEKKSSVAIYGAMTFEDIAALPVGALAKRDCALWLWVTLPLLLDGGDPKRHFIDHDAARSPVGAVMKAWGFRYVSAVPWLKRRSKGGLAYGTGYRFRSACELILVGIKGSPKTSRRERNFIDGLAREHSRKPEEGYAMAERWLPGGRYCELFSRTPRVGWDTWGEQAGHFEAVVDLGARSHLPPPNPNAHAQRGQAA
jgi:N6-adenosine-specific RNA methylase IME4